MEFPQFSYSEIERQFLDFLRNNDLEPIGNFSLQMDGKLHRYRLEGDSRSERSGAYICHDDGLPAGFVQDWRRGIKLNWTFTPDNINDEQRAYFNSEEFRKLQEQKKLSKRRSVKRNKRMPLKMLKKSGTVFYRPILNTRTLLAKTLNHTTYALTDILTA